MNIKLRVNYNDFSVAVGAAIWVKVNEIFYFSVGHLLAGEANI
jgi:hypothetical protein